MRRTQLAVFTVVAVHLLALPAGAPPTLAAPERSWGLGTAFGAGVAAVAVNLGGTKYGGVGLALELPTVELQFFTRSGSSIDLSLPLTNMIVVGALSNAFVLELTGYYNYNLGTGGVRFLLGPGLGFSVAAANGTAGGGKLAGVLGVEFLTRGRHFGFKLMTRPFVGYAGGGGGSGVVGGAMLELALAGYGTR
jgi:hypothetical protein